jgi:hypothetical protein
MEVQSEMEKGLKGKLIDKISEKINARKKYAKIQINS